MANEGYHESNLSEETRDMHRAIVSLMEELEAVDWYNPACGYLQQQGAACNSRPQP